MKNTFLKQSAFSLLVGFVSFSISGCKDENVGTRGICPVVIATSPVNLAVNVPQNQVISVTFNGDMLASTITPSSFQLVAEPSPLKTGGVQTMASVTVAGVLSYESTLQQLQFRPASPLPSGSTFTGSLATTITDSFGNPLQSPFTWSFKTGVPIGTGGISLLSAENFGILAGVGITSNGFSEIRNMNVGISPGVRSSVTGFPPAIMVNGEIFASDDSAPAGVAAMLTQAKLDLTAVYLALEGATYPAPATVAGDLGGTTLTAGIYKSTSTLLIQSGNLTLDGGGDPNAIFLFQIASDFTTVGGAGGSVILIGGAQAKNVFWQTGRSATIGGFTFFKGNILALTSITLNSGASTVGRMLAQNGSVVLTSGNIIEKP